VQVLSLLYNKSEEPLLIGMYRKELAGELCCMRAPPRTKHGARGHAERSLLEPRVRGWRWHRSPLLPDATRLPPLSPSFAGISAPRSVPLSAPPAPAALATASTPCARPLPCVHAQATNEDDYAERHEAFRNARALAFDLGTMQVLGARGARVCEERVQPWDSKRGAGSSLPMKCHAAYPCHLTHYLRQHWHALTLWIPPPQTRAAQAPAHAAL